MTLDEERFEMNTRNSTPEQRSPADIYDEQFVPALFRPWSGVVADAAGIGAGQRVLDVACGTGVLASTAAERTGALGSVVGLDANPQMLAVARRKALQHPIEWVDARAESLPFADASFDAVVSQFGFMFFDDRIKALREMMRVLRPCGRLAVAVCDALDHSPGYAALAALLERLFGNTVANAFRAPFVVGDAALLRSLCEQAGIARADVTAHHGDVRFASIAALVSAERDCAWTLGGLLDDAQFERLLNDAQHELRPFVQADGQIKFAMPALLITARKP
jgi:ubiquinone/menaquinone biosynthesis C-methylase UbiE